WKKCNSAAEDFQKSTGRELRIFKKDRYGSAPKSANPLIIITFSDGGEERSVRLQKKERTRSETFSKKCGTGDEDSGKSVTQLLKISKKVRITGGRSRKMIAPTSKKIGSKDRIDRFQNRSG